MFDDALNVRDPPDISSLPLILHNILNSELNKIISQLVVTDKVVGIVLDNMGSPFGGWKLDIRDKEAMRQLCKVYTILTNHNRIPVLVGIQLMLKAMNVLYLLEPSQLIDSNIFRNEMALAQFIVYLVEDMLPIIKSLGTEVLTELVRFASSIESFRALPCLLEIQNSIEPWDSVEEEGHFVIGEHYEFDNFQRSVHEENESKLDFTSKADVELFNERKKCFDSFSDMHRRWGERYQGVSLPENLSALRRDLFLSSTAILKVDAKNMPWLTKLFVERYLQAESATHKQSITISTNQFHQQSVLLQPSTKQLPKSSETDSTEIVQTSYANKLKQSLGLTSPVIDTSLLLKLERRLEAHAPSPVPTSLTTAPAATGSVSLSPLSSPFSFNSPATTFPSSGSSPCRSNPPQTSSIRVRTNRTNGVNVIAAVNALKTTTCDTALNILFPKHLQFFANFILECNNYRFIQTCATYVMKLIKQLTGSGLNSEGSGLNGVPLYKGDSLENLVRKLRLLGRLLAFLLFHHIPFNEAGLRSGISAGNSSTISEDDFIVAAVLPVQEMLMEAVQTGSTCLVVPWVCAFLKVLGAFEVGPTLGGYSVVAAVLYSLQTKHSLFSLSGTDLNSCRLLALVEIQSLWEEFPQALVTAKKALKAQSRDSNFLLPSFYFSGSNCPDNNNYRWTGKLLQLLSSNLYEQLQSLKMCQGRDLKLPQSPPKVDPTSPNTETLQARKQTKRQVIVPVQADALVSGNIAIVTNPAFAVPESMSRSSSISLLSAGRQSPISKVASSNTLMVKKKTSNKATKSSLSAASPVFEPAERRRASSSASKTTPTLTKQARVLPARNLFPDDNKVLLER
ncbi:hypothetical protein EON65_26740 [archaeon]|nr:MAG: hypothetical protein EON65_26740 [archaeon]